MAKTILIKDGRKETFVKEMFVVSAIKTGASVKVAREIAEFIKK